MKRNLISRNYVRQHNVMFATLALGVSTMKQRVIMAYNNFTEACISMMEAARLLRRALPSIITILDLYDLCLYFTPVISLNSYKLVGSLPLAPSCQWDWDSRDWDSVEVHALQTLQPHLRPTDGELPMVELRKAPQILSHIWKWGTLGPPDKTFISLWKTKLNVPMNSWFLVL